MRQKMYYYDFTLIPRMWIIPDSRGIAEDDHYTLLKWRNKLSVFVMHWLDLWYSWKLVGRWLIVPGPAHICCYRKSGCFRYSHWHQPVAGNYEQVENILLQKTDHASGGFD